MVDIIVNKNVCTLYKNQKDYKYFLNTYLVKYEDVTKVDIYNSTKKKKKFKTVKELRVLCTDYKDYIEFSRGLLEIIPDKEYKSTVVSLIL